MFNKVCTKSVNLSLPHCSRLSACAATRSFGQYHVDLCLLRAHCISATFEEYRKVSQYDIVRSIEHEMSGDLAKSMKAVVQGVKDRPIFFAERLYKAMKGLRDVSKAHFGVLIHLRHGYR